MTETLLADRARDLVTQRVATRARRFPDLDARPLELADPDGGPLDPRDAALAQAIDHAVARHWIALEVLLASRLQRPWDRVEHGVQAALLVGAAQVMLMDRVPDHAAIDAAVTWAKRRVRPKAAGIVNAVLRKVADLRGELVEGWSIDERDLWPRPDGRAWKLTEPVLRENPAERLAEATSHPPVLIQRWIAREGMQGAIGLAVHSLVHAPLLIAGHAGSEPPTGCRPHEVPGTFVFEGERTALDDLLASDPRLRVQDPASAAAVGLAAGLEPSLVVDACAGKGTKTAQLAEQHPGAEIIATDVDDARRATLAERFEGHERVRVLEPGALADAVTGSGRRVDLLVLDVPCSNTGVLARRVEARYRYGPAAIQSLVALQRQIVADTVGGLDESGHLLYATCSIDAEENEEQARWLERWHGLATIARSTERPRGGPGDDAAGYRDGGFAVLTTRGGPSPI